MRRFDTIVLMSGGALCLSTLVAEKAPCQKCERVREANALKSKDQNWVFYEDWLETEEGKDNSSTVESVSESEIESSYQIED